MRKSNLETGMVVKNRLGNFYRVFRDNVTGKQCIVRHDGNFCLLESFTEDLKHLRGKRGDLDIMAVYTTDAAGALLDVPPGEMELIWERSNYSKIHNAAGFKVGDVVKFTHFPSSYEKGWPYSQTEAGLSGLYVSPGGPRAISDEPRTISAIGEDYVRVSGYSSCKFPVTCLKPYTLKTITVDGVTYTEKIN